MFERFTEAAIKTIMLSQEESRRLGHNFVGSEQILLGLIGQGRGIAAECLRRKITLKTARTEVEKIIGRGSGFVAVEIPFTPRAKQLLENSWRVAQHLGHTYIGTEHLLLGLLDLPEGVAIRVLVSADVNLSNLRKEVLGRVGGDSGVDINYWNDLPTDPLIPDAGDLTDYNYRCYGHDAIAVLSRSCAAAEMLGNRLIGSNHMLLAMLQDESLLKAIAVSGASIAEVRRQILHSVQPEGENSSNGEKVFSEESHKIFHGAWAAAREHNHRQICKEHLLAGALCQESVGDKILKDLGGDPTASRSAISAALQQFATSTGSGEKVSHSTASEETASGESSSYKSKDVATGMTKERLLVLALLIVCLLCFLLYRFAKP